MKENITVNGRDFYMHNKPVVVVTIDGNEPAYFDEAIKKGLMPFVSEQKNKGLLFDAKSQLPSTTNTNNVSIITGVLPDEHGISANYYFDQDKQEDVMMTDPSLIRVPTILSEMQKSGCKVVAITAKDKLRKMLAKDLDFSTGTAICFSSELSASTTKDEHGIDNAEKAFNMKQPDVYSAELSEFVMNAGVQLLETFKPDVMYLTLTDYIQHTYAPDEEGALAFYKMLDTYFTQLDKAGCKLVITADHGMKAKSDDDGKPNIIYLNQMIADSLPSTDFRTVLPITDPYVAHHGALGAIAYLYTAEENIEPIMSLLKSKAGIYDVITNAQAVAEYHLPADRIGQLIVLADAKSVLGKAPEDHDLSKLHRKLRSHGGLFETDIPIVTNFNVDAIKDKPTQLKNSDAFWLAFNAE